MAGTAGNQRTVDSTELLINTRPVEFHGPQSAGFGEFGAMGRIIQQCDDRLGQIGDRVRRDKDAGAAIVDDLGNSADLSVGENVPLVTSPI